MMGIIKYAYNVATHLQSLAKPVNFLTFFILAVYQNYSCYFRARNLDHTNLVLTNGKNLNGVQGNVLTLLSSLLRVVHSPTLA